MTKRIALIALMLVAVLSSVGSATARVLPEGDSAPTLGPGDTVWPTGMVTSNVPNYEWSPVAGATDYQVKVKKGSKTIVNFTDSFAGCTTVCNYFSGGILSNKDYKWKVRAKVAGVWQPWSAWEKFSVKDTSGFKSSFNKNANGWTKLNGKWKVAKGKYVTRGKEGFFATSMHSDSYSTFTYEVRMRRVWDGDCPETPANNMYLRGTPEPLNGLKDWYQHMRYTYSDGGWTQISEDVDGVWNFLQSDTPDINQRGWNTLLVIAKGEQYWFYLNGQYVTTFVDDSHSSGVVGVGFFQESGCSDKLKVDWAKLSTNTPW